jgi:beta-glucosidase
MQFPKDFLWGAATASYQIEGAAREYGRGECIWTRFSHTPGKTYNGDTGDVACDHLHRYEGDIALMRQLGLQTYRFSISWPRVIPAGTGAPNPEGLEFYDRLIDALLTNGIAPYMTLYHWDLPQALQDRGGGWENPDSVNWFADYAELVTRRYGDRVKNWITHNEPWCTAFLGNLIGIHAPGKQDAPAAFKVAHHLLLSHGAAMGVIRRNVAESYAGIALNPAPVHPASYRPADHTAARLADGMRNRWFLDPLYNGHYPADLVEHLNAQGALDGLDLDAVRAANVPTDFLGVNFYNRDIVAATDNPAMPWDGVKPDYPGVEFTAMGWEVYAPSFTELLVRLWREYAPAALYITENGAAYPDAPPDGTGVVEDSARVAYIQRHLSAAADAIAQGVPLRGYFVWSFMDNFEWAEGYSKRFGVVYVDYPTQARTFKRSALVYRDLIAAQNGAG